MWVVMICALYKFSTLLFKWSISHLGTFSSFQIWLWDEDDDDCSKNGMNDLRGDGVTEKESCELGPIPDPSLSLLPPLEFCALLTFSVFTKQRDKK